MGTEGGSAGRAAQTMGGVCSPVYSFFYDRAFVNASSHGVDQAHLRSVGVREDQGRAKGQAAGKKSVKACSREGFSLQ
jgi:hypothetical protein